MALDVLSASTLSAGAPVIGEPALAQRHVLSASFVGGVPALGGPAIGMDASTLWPFAINWESSVTVEFEFKTGIITSRNAHEQRRADRDQPRKSWDYSFMAYRDAFREKMAQLTFRFAEEFYFINPMYKAVLAADFSIGGSSFDVVATPGWLVAECLAVLVSGDDIQRVRVLDVTGTTITIAGTNDTLRYAGTFLFPTEPVRISDDSIKVSGQTSTVINGGVKLDVTPSFALYTGTSTPGDIFNGREILLKKPNWVSSVDLALSSGRTEVDFGQGRNTFFSPVPFVFRDISATFLGRDLDEIEEVINLFCRMKGRRGEFYFPTGMADIVPSTPLVSGVSTLRTTGTSYFVAFNNPSLTGSSTVLKAMIVFLRDGTYLCREIDSVSESSGDSLFHVSEAWPATITPAEIQKISFLPVCRFGTDALSVELLTNSVGQFNLAIHALEAIDPE